MFRARSEAETLALLKSLMPRLGISRVTDTTRLDKLGLPVFASIRPRGSFMRVHAGKGLRAVDAEVGCLAEAVEYAVAEPNATPWQPSQLTIADLQAQWHGRLQMAELPATVDACWPENQTWTCVACEDLTSGSMLPLPAQLVFFPFERPGEPANWTTSTTGISAGSSVDEATLHGLLEVLERDAVSMNHALDRSQWVRAGSLPKPFDGLQQKWQALGVDLAVRHVPNGLGLPCFQAWLYERHDQTVDLAGGAGLHMNASVALNRAVCEAAQSRLGTIHGGRDDLVHFYDKWARPEWRAQALATTLAHCFDRTRSVDFRQLPPSPLAPRSTHTALRALLAHLAARGFPLVLRHRFDADLDGLQVVKVIVPLCEDVGRNTRRVGQRLRARLHLKTLLDGHG